MQIDPEDFRRLYASLSDEALLAVKREDLTDLARQYYDQELGQRGLKNEATTEESPGSASPPSEELVSVGFFQSMEELSFAKGLLRLAGIPAFSQNEARSAGKLFGLSGQLQLFVPTDMAEQAHEVLNADELTDEELAAQAEAAAMSEPEPDKPE